MFYLLENNKIIDSRISYTANFPYWEIKDNCLFAKSKNDKLVRPYNENKIKKQSENVFDLLETGDLVKYQTMLMEKFYFLMQEIKKDSFNAKDFYTILAIYKPDSEGNYIKVWEVKEDA